MTQPLLQSQGVLLPIGGPPERCADLIGTTELGEGIGVVLGRVILERGREWQTLREELPPALLAILLRQSGQIGDRLLDHWILEERESQPALVRPLSGAW